MLERLRAQVMHDVSGADDHDLAARANRWGADLFLAVRAGDSTAWEVAWFEMRSSRVVNFAQGRFVHCMCGLRMCMLWCMPIARRDGF